MSVGEPSRVDRGATLPRRRGRPPKLAADETPVTDRHVDGAARTSWLLSSARLLGPCPELAQREAFVSRLHELGVTCDLPRISRWESGQQPVPARVVVAYETALGLGRGALLAPARALMRAHETPADLALVSPDPRESDEVVQAAVSAAVNPDSPLDGGTWLALAMELSTFQRVFLDSSTWTAVCDRLIHELSRTVGRDHVRRYEACVALIQHPMAQRRMLRALGEWLTDPDVQLVAPMLGLLQEIDDEAAGELVLRLLGSQSEALALGVLPVAAAKAARGQFSSAAMGVLEHHALRRLQGTDGWTSGLEALDLAVHLPPASFDRIVRAVSGQRTRRRLADVRESGELAPAEVVKTVVRGLATQVQSMTPATFVMEADRVLRRLIQEAFFHASTRRRVLAARTLAATPYVDALADCCVQLIANSSDFIAQRAWNTQLHLGHGSRRPEILSLALHEPRPPLQSLGLTCVGLGERPLTVEEQDRVLELIRTRTEPDVLTGALMALGMAGSGRIADVPRLRPELAGTAGWWERHGAALHDRS